MPTGWFSQDWPFQGHPFLKGTVYLPRLNSMLRVDFLVDTGCTSTTLHPTDSLRMGLDFGLLNEGAGALGIGGRQRDFAEEAVISFEHGLQVVTYLQQIDIAPPLDHNRWLPSLLGMDVIRHWRMVCDVRNDVLAFNVHEADMTREVGTTP